MALSLCPVQLVASAALPFPFSPKLGYNVTAVNGVVDETDYLKTIGASDVVGV